jgi:arylsulfatase A-like enzyme
VAICGSSGASHLRDVKNATMHDENQHIAGWELFGLRVIHQGPWKLLWMPPPRGKERWELYDLSLNTGEVHDQVDAQPEIMAHLVQHWETCYTETGMFGPRHAFPYIQQ